MILHLAHLSCQRRLISHGGRHTPEKGADLGTGLGEAEDVVDEEEDVLRGGGIGGIAEGFRQGQAAQGNAGTRSGGLVHLPEDHRHLALRHLLAVYLGKVPLAFFHPLFELLAILDDLGFYHLPEEVVALAGALAHSGEDAESVMLLCDVVDELLDEHGLSHSRAAEEADLSALEVGLEEVDDLDAGEQDFLARGQFLELGGFAVDGEAPLAAELAQAVDGIAGDVHHAATDLGARGHGDGAARAFYLQPAAQAVGGVHCNAADGILANVLLHLYYKGLTIGLMHLQGVVDGRQGGLLLLAQVEVHVHYRADYLGNVSCNC